MFCYGRFRILIRASGVCCLGYRFLFSTFSFIRVYLFRGITVWFSVVVFSSWLLDIFGGRWRRKCLGLVFGVLVLVRKYEVFFGYLVRE